MTFSVSLEIYKAQTTNLKSLENAWKEINKNINLAIVTNNDNLLKILTKQSILIYCAYAETSFSKLIHTPYGLSIDKIKQIKNISKRNGISQGWKKCIELSVQRLDGKHNHIPNLKKKINELVDKYIFDPSLLRNKIAHGEWEIALNSEHTNINNDLSKLLNEIDIVKLTIYKNSFQLLIKILEDIIESPLKAHMKNYWVDITEYEENQKKFVTWTIEEKKEKLISKKQKRKEYIKLNLNNNDILKNN